LSLKTKRLIESQWKTLACRLL